MRNIAVAKRACTKGQGLTKPVVLAIDDDADVLDLLRSSLEDLAVEVRSAATGAAGWELFCAARPRIVLLDLRLPDLDGMDLLARMNASDPEAEIVLLTGFYSTASAVEAIKKGASDYLEKPFSIERLRQCVEERLRDYARRHPEAELTREEREEFASEGMIGASAPMLELMRNVRRLAPHYRTALITGPTGSGKEMVARALHRLSPAAAGSLVICNCAAIVESLFESEVFGYVKGALTGAAADKIGLFEAAHQGTLFLDEIGEMPLAMQGKLLRVIQSQQVTRVGAVAPRTVDVRVVAATNRELKQEVAAGRFREDLYFRLAAFEIAVPPLARRGEDLALLAGHFARLYAAQYGKAVRGVSRRALAALQRYDWPGNVRELDHVMARACLSAEGNWIEPRDLPSEVRGAAAARKAGAAAPGAAPGAADFETLAELERRHARAVVHSLHGNKVRAAQVLGISRATLYRLLREPPPRAS